MADENLTYPSPQIEMFATSRLLGESYESTYANGKIFLKASGNLGKNQGQAYLETAIKSRFWPECLGVAQPRFTLRPLWLMGTHGLPLTPNFTLALPPFLSYLKEDQIESCCQKIIELGYNAIVLGSFLPSLIKRSGFQLKQLVSFYRALHHHQLKMILKPTLEGNIPIEDTASEISCLFRELERMGLLPEAFLWESQLDRLENDPRQCGKTALEEVVQECQEIEGGLEGRSRLLFFIPSKDGESAAEQSTWLLEACQAIGHKVSLVFSAVAGPAFQDHLAPHPIWERLRQTIDPIYTPLMPLLNTGGLGQGEGLWPVIPFDLYERYYTACQRHNFEGILTLTPSLPSHHGFLACNLWVGGQLQWRNESPDRLLQGWFKAFWPKDDYGQYRSLLAEIRSLMLERSCLKAGLKNFEYGESRFFIEMLLIRIKILQIKLREEKLSLFTSFGPELPQCFACFAYYFKEELSEWARTRNLPFDRQGEENADLFWRQHDQTMQRLLMANEIF
jgi:hypothetical protein